MAKCILDHRRKVAVLLLRFSKLDVLEVRDRRRQTGC